MKKIRIDLFDIDIVFCKNKKKYIEAMEKTNVKNIPLFDYKGMTIQLDNDNGSLNSIVVVVDSHNSKIDYLDTLVHELSHATTLVMNYYAIDNDEFRSYLIGYLFKESYKYIKEKQ